MAQPQLSLKDYLLFLKNAVINDTSHNDLFQAAGGEAEWIMNVDERHTIQLIKTGYTGPAPAGRPFRLPNLSYKVLFPEYDDSLTLSPYVSYPSSDVAVNKATFVQCIQYFIDHPNTLSRTIPATNPGA